MAEASHFITLALCSVKNLHKRNPNFVTLNWLCAQKGLSMAGKVIELVADKSNRVLPSKPFQGLLSEIADFVGTVTRCGEAGLLINSIIFC